MKADAVNAQPRTPAEILKDYVFALADGLLVTVRAESEYAAARIVREECYC